MKKVDTTVRSYSARLFPTPEQQALLLTTQEIYNKGTCAATEIVLNLAASIRPTDAIPVIAEKVEKAEKSKPVKPSKGNKKNQPKENPKEKLPLEWGTALACFANWFTIERPRDRHPEHQVNASEVSDRFEKYWKETGGDLAALSDPLLQLHLNNISQDSQRDDATWVDRFALSNQFLSRFGIPREQAVQLVLFLGWPFVLKNGEPDAPKLGRAICSQLFGTGKKHDFSEDIEFYDYVKGILSQEDWISHTTYELAVKLPKPPSKSGPQNAIVELANAFGYIESLNSEKRPTLRQRQKAIKAKESLQVIIDDKYIKNFHKIVATNLEHADGRSNLSLDSAWRTSLLEHLIAETGVPYYTNGACQIKHFSQFIAFAAADIGSNKSTTLNQAFTRFHAQEDLDKAKLLIPEIDPDILSITLSYLASVEQTYLRGYQFKGIHDVVMISKKRNLTLLNAVKAAQSEDEQIGDPNLLIALADNLTLQQFYTAKRSLDLLTKIHEAEESVATLKYPCLNVDRCPYRPWFGGDSQPAGTLIPQEKGFSVAFELLNAQGVTVPTTINAYSKRVTKEILTRQSNPTQLYPRNHYLFRMDNNGQQVSPAEPVSIAIQPFLEDKNNNHYIRLSFKLQTMPKPYVKEIQAKEKLRILAVDRGWRNAGAYVVLERCEQGQFYITGGNNGFIKFRIVETGMVQDRQQFSKTDLTTVDRLSNCDRPPTVEELDFLANVAKPVSPRNVRRRDPVNFSDVRLQLAHIALAWTRTLGKKTDSPEPQQLESVTDRLKQIMDFCITNRGKTHLGGLSYTRIDALDVFLRSYRSLLHFYENNKQSPPTWLAESYERLLSKRVSRRRERARITASKIVEVAIRCKAQVMVIEKLSLQTSGNNSRGMNRRTAQWTQSQVANLLDQACTLHGIFLKQVSAWNTSQLDSTNPNLLPQCRLTANLPENLAKEIDKIIEKNSPSAKRFYQQSAAWYEDKGAEFFGIHPYNTEDLATRLQRHHPFVPSGFGEFFEVAYPRLFPAHCIHHNKFVDSDINAAVNIGLRALRYLFFGGEKINSEAKIELDSTV